MWVLKVCLLILNKRPLKSKVIFEYPNLPQYFFKIFLGNLNLTHRCQSIFRECYFHPAIFQVFFAVTAVYTVRRLKGNIYKNVCSLCVRKNDLS